MNNKMNGLQYFVIILDINKKNKFLSLLGEYGAHAIDTVYGYGSVNSNVVVSAFGFEARSKKAIISCLLKNDKAKELLDVLYKKYKFEKPNTGFAFSIPIEELAF